MNYDPRTLYDGFFFAAVGFLLGTVLGAYAVPLYAVFIASLCGYFFLRKIRARAWLCFLLSLSALLGFLYYSIDEYRYQREQEALRNETVFTGTIARVPRERVAGQSLFVTLDNARGNILVYTDTAREHSYGEYIRISGTLTPPPEDSYGTYLAQEHVSGTLFGGEITVLSHNGNVLLARLFSLQEHIRVTLAKHFTHDATALMQAILIGNRDSLSPTLVENLSISGTLHITALSGGHITIITFALYAGFAALMPTRKRLSFFITFVTVALFVAMTGFVVSAVRAALMAVAAHVGHLVGRNRNPRNVIALTALILTIFNPKTPTADVGFQLSCLATIGIIYGTPILGRLSFFIKPGVAAYRHILAATIAAQVAVFPLTVTLFQNFSFVSLPANIAVVFVMPLLTVGGFVLIAANALHAVLGSIVAVPLSFLLSYTQNAVELFAAMAVPFNPRLGMGAVAIYYALLVWGISTWSTRENPIPRRSLP